MMKLGLVAALVGACHGFVAASAPRTPAMHAARTPAPHANFLNDLGKIAEYNRKYFATALSSVFDDRTATASHILFGFAKYEDGEQQAVALKQRIEAGEISFADAAKEYSTCPSAARGGSLGSFKKGAMVPEFDAVCFDEDVPLGGTAVNGPVKTQFGHHLIQVYERAAAK